MNNLAAIQQWLQEVIQHPDGHNQEKVEAVVAPSPSLSAANRIAVYQQAYHARLLECFQSEFKGLHNAIGDDLFRHFVWSYLQKHPSTSYTLNDLGKLFPQFLEDSLIESLDGASPDWWQQFIIDMVKFERMYADTFNGDGHEELLENTMYTSAPLKLSPSVQLLKLHFPIADCIHTFRKRHSEEYPPQQTTRYVFSRNNYKVQVNAVDEVAWKVLQDWLTNEDEPCPVPYETRWEICGLAYR